MTLDTLLFAASIGVGATAFMDVVAYAQKQLFAQPSLDYTMVGRWCGHAIQGRLIHRPISASQPIQAERSLGWGLHYCIGMIFAWGFLVVVGQAWLQSPRLLPALAWGGFTVLAPFLILQPGMGAGIAARHMPNPNIMRIRSLFAHLCFGFGIWAAAMCVERLS